MKLTMMLLGGLGLGLCMLTGAAATNDDEPGANGGGDMLGELKDLIREPEQAVEPGWNLKPDRVHTNDRVGIRVNQPTAQFDMKGTARFRNRILANDKITFDDGGSNGKAVIQNRSDYAHFLGDQTIVDERGPFFIASETGRADSSGIAGDEASVTIWSSGDGQPGQPQALIYVVDDDGWFDGDDDPYDNGALKAYVNVAGVWTASDENRKQNIEPLVGATDALMRINGYTYEYRPAPEEMEEDQRPLRVSGLIAQELIDVLPEAVEVNADGEHFVNMSNVIPLLVEALKDQVYINDEQAERMAALEARLDALEDVIGQR